MSAEDVTFAASVDNSLQPLILLSPRKPTVLLADDEAIVRTVATTMLKRLGYDVILAAEGHEAIAVFAREHHNIDLVIFDLMLPDMSGEELYAQLRAISPGTPAMLTTGYSECEALDQ